MGTLKIKSVSFPEKERKRIKINLSMTEQSLLITFIYGKFIQDYDYARVNKMPHKLKICPSNGSV